MLGFNINLKNNQFFYHFTWNCTTVGTRARVTCVWNLEERKMKYPKMKKKKKFFPKADWQTLTTHKRKNVLIRIKMFTVLFIIAKILRQPKCPMTDKQIKKMWYTYSGILLSHKVEWNLEICDNMDVREDHYA